MSYTPSSGAEGTGDMLAANNLSDVANIATARSNLGVTTLDAILAAIYPVGAIYTSVDNTNPGTLFGGTWEAFGAGKTLIGVDSGDTDFDTVEESGGTKTKAISAHAGTAVADHAAHTHSVTSNVAVADHSAHTHSVTSNVAVADHSSHTHTYTDVPNHVHVQRGTTTATGNFSGLIIDTSAGGNGGTISDTTTGHSTQNPTGGVITGTTAGPSATLSHGVTNNAVTSGNPSATLSHSVTNNAVTSGNPSATLTHSVTQANDHTALNVVQPYITVYFFKRTA